MTVNITSTGSVAAVRADASAQMALALDGDTCAAIRNVIAHQLGGFSDSDRVTLRVVVEVEATTASRVVSTVPAIASVLEGAPPASEE